VCSLQGDEAAPSVAEKLEELKGESAARLHLLRMLLFISIKTKSNCSSAVMWTAGSIRCNHTLAAVLASVQRFSHLPVPAAVDDTELNLGEKKKKKKKKVVLEDAVNIWLLQYRQPPSTNQHSLRHWLHTSGRNVVPFQRIIPMAQLVFSISRTPCWARTAPLQRMRRSQQATWT